MNIEQFAALKVGDKVQNGINPGAPGEVVETNERGVRVVWGPRNDAETRFFYAATGTAWFHWNKVDEDAG